MSIQLDSHLPAVLPGWIAHFKAGLSILEASPGSPATPRALSLLDAAVGIVLSPGNPPRASGLTQSSASGARSLPLSLLRRVEYERAALRLGCDASTRALLQRSLPHADVHGVHDRASAAAYLRLRARFSDARVAQTLLRKLAPPGGPVEEYRDAISAGDIEGALEAADKLRGGLGARPEDAEAYVRLDERSRRGICANNTGFALVRGAPGIRANAEEAVKYYEIGVACGSTAASCNLGRLYADGAPGVERDARRARDLFEVALARGERDFAPRHMGSLLLKGAPGIPQDVNGAAAYWVIGVMEGSDEAKLKSKEKLRSLLSSWRRVLLTQRMRAEVRRIVADPVVEIRFRKGGDAEVRLEGRQGARKSFAGREDFVSTDKADVTRTLTTGAMWSERKWNSRRR